MSADSCHVKNLFLVFFLFAFVSSSIYAVACFLVALLKHLFLEDIVFIMSVRRRTYTTDGTKFEERMQFLLPSLFRLLAKRDKNNGNSREIKITSWSFFPLSSPLICSLGKQF